MSLKIEMSLGSDHTSFHIKKLPPCECTNVHANDRYYHSAALSNQISCICLHMRVPVRLKNERNWRRALSRVIPSNSTRSDRCRVLMLTCRNSALWQRCKCCNNVLSLFWPFGRHSSINPTVWSSRDMCVN